jgi:20S proteasome alpha/beta subunit
MTVCIARLAEHSRAMVLVADKASTIGMMQDDTDAQKMLRVGRSSWMALTAGDGGRCDAVVREVAEATDGDKAVTSDASRFAKCIQEIYRKHRDEVTDQEVLAPNLLTRELWSARPATLQTLPNSVVGQVQDELAEFRGDGGFDCELLFCGFDANRKPNIIWIDEGSVAHNITNEGFHSIGSGAPTAFGRLLWQSIRRTDELGRALYETFNAKAHAEQIAGVGYAWDARIIIGEHIVAPPPTIKKLIEKVFECSVQSPFKRQLAKVPRDWRETLEAYGKQVMVRPDRERSRPRPTAKRKRRS